jgi:hypothetical protein
MPLVFTCYERRPWHRGRLSLSRANPAAALRVCTRHAARILPVLPCRGALGVMALFMDHARAEPIDSS